MENINKRQLIINGVFALYWLFAYYFFKLFYGGWDAPEKVSLTFTLIFLFISFACVDIHHRFVTKTNLAGRRYFRFIIFSLFVFVTAFWLESILTFILHFFFWSFDNADKIEEANRVRYQVGGVNMIVFGGVAFRFVVETLSLQRQKEEKDKQAFEAHLKVKEVELDLLKSQVNPHFLFNALNCIYGLSLEKSEHTPEVIMQLSEILDYMLYKSNDEVLLSDEIKQIENYTAIQKVRFGESLQLTFTKELERDFSMAPLLLLTLVENAFKHGKPSKDGILKVDIHIKAKESIHFFVCNSCNGNEKSEIATGGIGLTNLKRRLELMYGNRFMLTTERDEATFEAILTINSVGNEEE
ncbi:histidine kinase [Carboxylicivirga sp. A043]|uniref:sensor histidine kinase n=1 Tax=Carboxylicivirga litoralis TaxID=2816963 RepID=UPI0021CB951A|nr:histidine kinase [Carboxylicivirga sp. A043]MCU4155928.1 histidine kinase [Carboxylicivirga sp. A043]